MKKKKNALFFHFDVDHFSKIWPYPAAKFEKILIESTI